MVRKFLLACFQQEQMAALAARRPKYQTLLQGFDKWATLKEVGLLRRESAASALRAVMGGSVVTEDIACKWTKTGSKCPHCKQDTETAHHRWWLCPAWANTRLATMQGRTLHWLSARLPPLTMETGLLPANQEVRKAREERALLRGPKGPKTGQ